MYYVQKFDTFTKKKLVLNRYKKKQFLDSKRNKRCNGFTMITSL